MSNRLHKNPDHRPLQFLDVNRYMLNWSLWTFTRRISFCSVFKISEFPHLFPFEKSKASCQSTRWLHYEGSEFCEGLRSEFLRHPLKSFGKNLRFEHASATAQNLLICVKHILCPLLFYYTNSNQLWFFSLFQSPETKCQSLLVTRRH